MMRECRYCHEVKPMDAFIQDKKRESGRQWMCKACRAEKSRKWREDNPERNRQLQRNARQKNDGENWLALTTKKRRNDAAMRGARIVENVDPLVVLERDDGVCGICREDVDPFDFTIDHIEPCADGGDHSYENIQLAHQGCNKRKFWAERKVAA